MARKVLNKNRNKSHSTLNQSFINQIVKKRNVFYDTEKEQKCYRTVDKRYSLYKVVLKTQEQEYRVVNSGNSTIVYASLCNRPNKELYFELLHWGFDLTNLCDLLGINFSDTNEWILEDFISMKEIQKYIVKIPSYISSYEGLKRELIRLKRTDINAEKRSKKNKKVEKSKRKAENKEKQKIQDEKNVSEFEEFALEPIEGFTLDGREEFIHIEDKRESETTISNSKEDAVVSIDESKVEKKTRKRTVVTLQDYQRLLGFSGIEFDFNELTKDIYNHLGLMSFDEYLKQKNKQGFFLLVSAVLCFNKVYNYRTPFYPAEDEILKEYYRYTGYKVVEIMKAVIPNYQARPDYEYLYRIRQMGYKTPHPKDAFVPFGVLDFEIDLLRALFEKVKKSPTKYFPWFDIFDLKFYGEIFDLGEVKTKSVKNRIDFETLDIKPFIDSAKKLREVKFHTIYWTSDRHFLFKEIFRNAGLAVLTKVDGLTRDEAIKHSLQYKIFQKYTEDEVQRMHEVYLQEGLAGLLREFSYRTEEALKYKIEDEGWDRETSNNSIVNVDIESMRAEISNQLKEEFQKNEVPRIEKEVEERLKADLEKRKEQIEQAERERIQGVLSELFSDNLQKGVKEEIGRLMDDCKIGDLVDVYPNRLLQYLLNSMQKKLQSS